MAPLLVSALVMQGGDCATQMTAVTGASAAVLVEVNSTTILVDAGPDIRNQLLPHQLTKIDAVLITHTHSDHVAGLDDLSFYWPERNDIKIYATAHHGKDIFARFVSFYKNQICRLILFPQWRCIKLKLAHKSQLAVAKLISCIRIMEIQRRSVLCLMTNLLIQPMSLI